MVMTIAAKQLSSDLKLFLLASRIQLLESRAFMILTRLHREFSRAWNKLAGFLVLLASRTGRERLGARARDMLGRRLRSWSSATGGESPRFTLSSGQLSNLLACKLALVFIHCGHSDYLEHSLRQARTTNPFAKICLIGDSSNNRYPFVEHVPMANHFESAERFSRVYRHYNSNGYNYELFNFQRWFILNDFLKANQISKCVYLDSDVMVYADLSAEFRKFEWFDFTLASMICGCTFFLNRPDALDEFCRFVTDVYSGKDRYHLDKLVAHYTCLKRNRFGGGVCDMTAFELYHLRHYDTIGEVTHIIEGSAYDPSLNDPHPGVLMENGIKKLFWRENKPYGVHARTGTEIRFNTLHFQGELKRLMGQYLRA